MNPEKEAQMKEWTTIDKGEWGAGPWDNEPDKVHFIDEETDLDCLLVRGPGGQWCGYVAVEEGHPFYGVGYDECAKKPPCDDSYCAHAPENKVEVHGGLTYSDFCQKTDDPSDGICHVAEPGRPEKVWWLGFDCAHHMDVSPAFDLRLREMGFKNTGATYRTYRDRAYAEAETRKLAGQLKAIA